MTKKLIITFIVLLLFGFVLTITRPDETNFKEWSKNKYANTRSNTENGLIMFLKNWTNLQIIQTEKYHNKILFAIVKADIYGKETTYLGILGNWFVVGRK